MNGHTTTVVYICRLYNNLLLAITLPCRLIPFTAGDPADYDDLVGGDTGEVTMEDANRILNSNEDDSDSPHGNTMGGFHSPPGTASAISDTIQRKRSLSVASAL